MYVLAHNVHAMGSATGGDGGNGDSDDHVVDMMMWVVDGGVCVGVVVWV